MNAAKRCARLDRVAEAAADRGVLIGHAPGGWVRVSARQACWRLSVCGGDFPGWQALRVDGIGDGLVAVPGWLGDTDLAPDRVVDNLLRLPWLPAARPGWSCPVGTSHPWTTIEDLG